MLEIHAEEIGRDRGTNGTPHPLVMLHGWGHSLQALKPLGEHLSSCAQVHLIDLPGFGLSPIPDTTWSVFDYAARIIAYLDAQGIDKADFLGHSFGGKISLAIAIRYPERVRKLIIMNAPGLRRKRSTREQCRFTAIRWLGKSIKMLDRVAKSQLFRTFFVPRFGSTDYQQAGPMRAILVASVNHQFSELKTIQAKTLILWGDQDKETPPEIAQRMHRAIPDSKLLLFAGKGHRIYEGCGSHLCAFHIRPFLMGEKP